MTPYNPEAKYDQEEGKSIFGVIVHSFFVVPFLIAVFSVLLFAAIRILTVEQNTVFDYLEDVKTGGLTKRWQAAFELSKILTNPKLIPPEERFATEMIAAFDHAQYDDDRVRQYLALAMGRTGNQRFVEPLVAVLRNEKEENLYSLIYSLGLLKSPKAVFAIEPFLQHSNSKVRLAAVIALGNIGDERSLALIKKSLNDSEPNVRWDAAIALAKAKDFSGKSILLKLLNRNYFKNFPKVDAQEQDHVLLVVLEAAAPLKDPEIKAAIEQLAAHDRNMNVRRAAMEALK